MALVFLDSFDHYAAADFLKKWTSSNGANSMATGRFGSGQAFRWQGGATSTFSLAPSSPLPSGDTFIIGFALYPTQISVNSSYTPVLFHVADSVGGVQFALTTTASPQPYFLQVRRGDDNGTLLGTASVALVESAWQYVELKVKIHASAGTVDVRINGVSVLSLTGQNTQGGSNAQWNSMTWAQHASGMGGFSDFRIDDLYLLDGSGGVNNNFWGDTRIDCHYPTGTGSSAQWTPSAGANWENVDEAPPDGDTTYNTTNTTNHVDSFALANLANAGGTIKGVQAVLCAKKDKAGPAIIRPRFEISATEYLGAEYSPVSGNYSFGRSCHDVSPATAAAWTESEFNAMEFGYKRTT